MLRTHATLAGLAQRESLRDLAQAGAPDDTTVGAALLGEAITGEFAAGRSQDERDAAAQAVERLQRDVDDANTEVDSYLARYPALPAGGPVAVYAVDIAAYRILGGDRESERYVRYQTALRFLRDVSSGAIDLSDGEAAETGSGADVDYEGPKRVFDAGTLGDYVNPPAGTL